ncbi:hypothetical protein E2C01_052504 [Portunus trituberculatus]|uniref:Uncharacterized protein n=1 Tax=Portunus trituberculatus TaxID=210409 RepID=A0A5B7GN74_PORTR|nr:hypothetical protein [Portunus trituberculatus]
MSSPSLSLQPPPSPVVTPQAAALSDTFRWTFPRGGSSRVAMLSFVSPDDGERHGWSPRASEYFLKMMMKNEMKNEEEWTSVASTEEWSV